MLRALKYFIACLASFPFLVPNSPSRPVSHPVIPTRHHPSQVPIRSTFPSVNSPAPWNAGFSRQPARSTFPSVNSPAPWNAGFSRQPTSVPYFPYEDCPASFPQCQT